MCSALRRAMRVVDERGRMPLPDLRHDLPPSIVSRDLESAVVALHQMERLARLSVGTDNVQKLLAVGVEHAAWGVGFYREDHSSLLSLNSAPARYHARLLVSRPCGVDSTARRRVITFQINTGYGCPS